MRLIVSGLLELAGISAITAGFYLIAPYLGLIFGGIALIVVALAVDPPKRRSISERAHSDEQPSP